MGCKQYLKPPMPLIFSTFFFPFFLLSLFLLHILACPAVKADDLKRNIVAGMPKNFPPHFYIDQDTGKPSGFSVDVMDAIAAQGNLKIQYKAFDSWTKTNQAAKDGVIDIIPNMGFTPERESFLDFTSPYETFRINFYIRTSSHDLLSTEDIGQRKVGVVVTNKARFILEEQGGYNLVKVESHEELVMLLISGDIDVIAIPEPFIHNILQKSKLHDRVVLLGKPLVEIKRGIAIGKGRDELLTLLRPAVDTFIQSPEYQEILEKWYGSPEPFWNVKKVALLMSTLLGACTILLLLWRYVSIVQLNKSLNVSVDRQRRAEKQLRINEGVLNKAQEIAHLGSWHLDIKKNILTWSDETYRIFGLHPQEFDATYEAFLEAVHPDDRKMLTDTYTNAVKNNAPYECMHRVVRPNGEVRVVLERSDDIIDESGETTHSFGMTHDITAQVLAEEKLRKSQEEWEKTFNSIPDIITLQDKEMRIVRANRAASDFFEVDNADLIGKYCYEVFRGITAPCHGCPLVETIKEGKNYAETIQHDNLGKIFQVSSSPILDENKELQLLVHIAKDITEYKKVEEELFQAHKMEAIGTLAGGIAHDFNNILTAIIGYSEIAKLDLPADSHARQDIDQVLKAGNRAAELVKQILTFSRKSDHRRELISPHLIIKEALKMLRSSLPTTIKLQEDIDVECGQIMAAPTNIHQIVVNLCTNSLHAMESEKGMIHVGLHRQEISADQIAGEPGVSPGPIIVLEVADTGHGMDQATIKRIFEPYFTTKDVGKGTGLGLAVLRGIIQDYHGFIRVESEPGQGTTFYVHIPAVQQQAATIDKAAMDEPLATGTERILLVDDEVMIAHMNKAILTQLGYQVSATTDSLDALERIRRNPDQFDLVITDQTMPNLTGAELTQEILKIKDSMAIILCTGYSSVLSQEDALALGIKKYARKPVDMTTLAKIVRQALDENQG